MDENKCLEFEDVLQINENEIISVVGSGGKTSFIDYIANKYKNKKNILLTTTTKIYVPRESRYKDIYMIDENKKINISSDAGVTVIGKYINEENKIVGINFEELRSLISSFNLTIIEADGSKRKKLKGWNITEPVVSPNSSKTIGVLDITSYGMDINNENIHRLEELRNITDINSSKIGITNLVDIVLNQDGLFKNACGEKILFIGKVETEESEKIAKFLINKINMYEHNLNIIYGSVKNNYFKK